MFATNKVTDLSEKFVLFLVMTAGFLMLFAVLIHINTAIADTSITIGTGGGAIETAGNTLSNLLYNIIGKILFVVFIFGGIVMMWKSMAAAFIMWGMAILLAFATGLSSEIWTLFHS